MYSAGVAGGDGGQPNLGSGGGDATDMKYYRRVMTGMKE